MITTATLAAIVECAPLGDRRLAIELVEIACSCANIAQAPVAKPIREKRVMRALDAIDDLEDLATRRMCGRTPLRARRALLILRALVARARPVTHDRGAFLCDDDAGALQWWHVGKRGAANDNADENLGFEFEVCR